MNTDIGESILHCVLNIKHATDFSNELLKQLQTNSIFFEKECKKIPLIESTNKSKGYTRTILAKESDIYEGFEIVIVDWNLIDKHCHIHGHPQLMYYQVLSGTYIMNLYLIDNDDQNLVTFKESIILKKGDIYKSLGVINGYSNAIHSIQCISSGRTINIYSGDAMKGESYILVSPFKSK